MIDSTILGLSEAVGKVLHQKGLLLSCAESCTGGLVAAAITAVSGSSAWFDRGFVTYSNQAKTDHLGVSLQTLQDYGAVSPETAAAMACGVLQASLSSSIALSTTGIAGPGGATPGKPVGMVCFGVAWRSPHGVAHETFTQYFAGDRSEVRMASVQFALQAAIQTTRQRFGEPR